MDINSKIRLVPGLQDQVVAYINLIRSMEKLIRSGTNCSLIEVLDRARAELHAQILASLGCKDPAYKGQCEQKCCKPCVRFRLAELVENIRDAA